MTAQAIVSVENLVKRYGDWVAVDHLSFTVRKGEVFGLLGPNGAGKTTTLSILSSLLEANEGVITLCGHDLKKAHRKVKPLIGVVPQDIALYPSLSARDNLRFFGSVYGLRGKALSQRVDETLAAVGLADRAKDPVQNFSGGMKRRVNIAAGLIHRPQVLFLDEPTVGVDPQSRNFIFEYVEQLKRDGMTVIYTTHYMEEAEQLCDRIAIVNAGRIIALDTLQGLIGLLAAIGGCFVPTFVMPDWMRAASLATPHGWALNAYVDLIVRGYSFMQVLPAIGVLFGFALVFLAVGVWRFRFD